MNKITYNGLTDLPEVKADLNKWCAHLLTAINKPDMNLSDMAGVLINYADLFETTGKDLFEIFKKQLDSETKEIV